MSSLAHSSVENWPRIRPTAQHTPRKGRRIRGEPSQRMAAQIAAIENEYPAETIERLRKAIKGLAIIDRLQGHIFGQVDLSATQVRACEILLDRILPKLAAVQVALADDIRPTVIYAPKPFETPAEWEAWCAAQNAAKTLPSPRVDLEDRAA